MILEIIYLLKLQTAVFAILRESLPAYITQHTSRDRLLMFLLLIGVLFYRQVNVNMILVGDNRIFKLSLSIIIILLIYNNLIIIYNNNF